MAITRRVDSGPVSLERDRAVKRAQVCALTALDQLKFWEGRGDWEGAARARIRMDVALDKLLSLGVGR